MSRRIARPLRLCGRRHVQPKFLTKSRLRRGAAAAVAGATGVQRRRPTSIRRCPTTDSMQPDGHGTSRDHQTAARSTARHYSVGSRKCHSYRVVTAGPVAAVPSTLVKPSLIMRWHAPLAALVLTHSIMTSPPTHVAARPSEFPHRACCVAALERCVLGELQPKPTVRHDADWSASR